MLTTLKIKNFALIEDQTIEFKNGFNVIVGETGSGKSLILDALNFVLGDKANKLNIRHNTNKIFVQAVFDKPPKEIQNLLSDNGIDLDDNLILSRSYTIDGKNECRVNSVIVTTALVKNIASILIDMCGQNENIELLKAKNHLNILDQFAGDEITQLKNDIIILLKKYNEIKNEMDKIGGNKQGRERELDLLEYQIKEIEDSNIKIGEDEEIKNQIVKLSNYEKIFEGLNGANKNLDSASDTIISAQSYLESSAKYDDNLQNLNERLVSVKIELDDINEILKDYLNNFEFDENQLENLDARFETLKSLKKKYGSTIEDILVYLNKIKEDYNNLLFSEEKLQKLENDGSKIKDILYEKCLELSNARKKVASLIEQRVMAELKLLGFKNAVFKVDFKVTPSINDAKFDKNGIDDIEFLLSANVGQELKSLSKTISGGEMSRFMLALKSVFANNFGNTALVFDEIDTGISGEIGQKVAEKLAILSKSYQLICITHMCQVTAMADNYIYVKKTVENNNTFTKISYLHNEEQIKYIAVVSGAEPTEVALRFATELKEKADIFKNSL